VATRSSHSTKDRGPKKSAAKAPRREPQQQRARQTVAAVLDAVVRILKRQGIDGVTTNRIAEVAGVSIGSVYQYFPDKRAVFAALHERHREQMAALVERAMLDHAAAPLGALVRALVEALIDAHAIDPELHDLLASEVPHGAQGAEAFEARLRRALRVAFDARSRELPRGRDVERLLFTVPIVIDAMAHGAALRRPPRLSAAAAKEEAVRAALACLGARRA
jgi:AcrR family transcriptional regulator